MEIEIVTEEGKSKIYNSSKELFKDCNFDYSLEIDEYDLLVENLSNSNIDWQMTPKRIKLAKIICGLWIPEFQDYIVEIIFDNKISYRLINSYKLIELNKYRNMYEW